MPSLLKYIGVECKRSCMCHGLAGCGRWLKPVAEFALLVVSLLALSVREAVVTRRAAPGLGIEPPRFAAIFEVQFRGSDLQPQLMEFTKVPVKSRYRSCSRVEIPDHGCTPDSYTYATLVNELCKLGKISEAKELFREVDAKGCSPTIVTYTSLIHRSCLSNILNEAMKLFEEMSRKGIEPNVVTFSSLIDGFCKGGRSLQALKLLEKMILDRMKLQGLKLDVVLYGRLVNNIFNSSKFQEAVNLLDEMVPCGMLPNHVSWSLHVNNHNMAVHGLCTEKDLNQAFQIYLSTRTKQILADSETYKSLMGCFSKKGDVYKASQIVNEI
ncbi:hypothetical protein GIB67_042435 [Kingdonia uniflora]|uniref:Pentatricopeptide repeat-containing protein n=1 Tax=Kingdonia uniflora TaxID=39325 RepID=A0A7J7M8J0_9MAGN|nr:hypothetical protein GIB67_042435 [Kingdonia uniflora]